MNMVRIRRIMAMRKTANAPPLLPPKLKRNSFDAPERRSTCKEIVGFNVQLREFSLYSILPSDVLLVCTVYESEGGGKNGPWRIVASSDVFPLQSFVDLQELFSIEFMFEVPQPIRIELCTWTEEAVISLGYTIFSVSEVAITKRSILPIICETDSRIVAVVDVFSSVKDRPPSYLIQLEGRDFNKKIVSESHSLFLQICDADSTSTSTGLSSSFLYRSEIIRAGAKATWKPFTLSSEGEERENKPLDVLCCYKDEKTKQEGLVGKFQTTLSQMHRETGEANVNFLTNILYKEGKKAVGAIETIKCTTVANPSFLDFMTTGNSLHLSFAVDFSSPDESGETWAPDFQDEVEFAIRAIGDCVVDFAPRNISAYGFGGRIPPQLRESQEFCLSLETCASCNNIDGVLEVFRYAMSQVKPAKAAQFAHVIYYLSKIAQNTFLRREPGSPTTYFVLVIITRGDISDLKEAVQAVIFASRTALSIIFVGIGDGKMGELERLGSSGTRLAFQSRKAARDIVHFVDLRSLNRSKPSTEDDAACLSERALYRLPAQFLSFVTKTSRECLISQKKLSFAHGGSMCPSLTRYTFSPTPSLDQSSSITAEVNNAEKIEGYYYPSSPPTPQQLSQKSPNYPGARPFSQLCLPTLHTTSSPTFSSLGSSASTEPSPPGQRVFGHGHRSPGSSSSVSHPLAANSHVLDHPSGESHGVPEHRRSSPTTVAERAKNRRSAKRLSHEFRSLSMQGPGFMPEERNCKSRDYAD